MYPDQPDACTAVFLNPQKMTATKTGITLSIVVPHRSDPPSNRVKNSQTFKQTRTGTGCKKSNRPPYRAQYPNYHDVIIIT
jgi:hypothetical protein